MKKLFIVRGLPGSGKSTLAEFLVAGKDGIIIENDQYMYENGVYVWAQHKMKGAVKYVKDSLIKAVSENKEVIVISNVFCRSSVFNSYIEYAKQYGYDATVMIVENRNDTKSIHNVSDETIDSMSSNFEIKLK